jgi:hypothetical protein
MNYTRPHHYTKAELAYASLRDLVTDIRCARRDGLPDYAIKCVAEFRALWPRRHA